MPTPSPATLAFPLIEAYVETVGQAAAAVDEGAARLELCGPGAGGLTPSDDLVDHVLGISRAPVHLMVRARTGDFVFDAEDLLRMRRTARRFRETGAAGIVTGALGADGTVNRGWMESLIAEARPLKVVFHRAFDATSDADAALDTLLTLGVDGVLTSGHAPTAREGAATIARHVARAPTGFEVIAGGGVRADHLRELIARTGVRSIHARGTEPEVIRALATASRSL
jgi:copper homeostasis protein